MACGPSASLVGSYEHVTGQADPLPSFRLLRLRTAICVLVRVDPGDRYTHGAIWAYFN